MGSVGGSTGVNRLHFFSKRYPKSGVITFKLLVSTGMLFYTLLLFGKHTDYTHFFYIPIAVAGAWWGRKCVWVAISLGILLMIPHLLSGVSGYIGDLLRSLMFIIVAWITGTIREDSLEYEARIREQKAFSEKLVLNSKVPTFVLNPRHQVLVWNKACEELTGMRASDVIGTDDHWKAFYETKRPCLSDVIIEDNIEDLPNLYQVYSESDIISHGLHGEGWFTNHGGIERFFIFDAAPIKNADGELIAVIQTLQDFTGSKRTEEALFHENRKVQEQLQLASTVQASLFPIRLPQVDGVTLAASAVTAHEVGGDYCDLVVMNNKKLGIAIGDVMGKGVPAALFTVMTFSFVRNYALELDSPSMLVNRLNRELYPRLEFSKRFLTFFYGLYDPSTRELTYTNAGHNPPIVYRALTGEFETLPVKNYFIGGRLEAQYDEGKVNLEPGDLVFFYTDGLKEGRNREKEQFGLERIIDLLKEHHMYDPASIEELIQANFLDFLAGENIQDDVTMIVLKLQEN